MAREKTVYPTGEIAHLWAHQAKASARNPQGNFSFDGDFLLSYTTRIARLLTIKKQRVALLIDRSYSATTNGHQSDMRRAVSHLQSFTVPNIGGRTYDGFTISKTEHAENFANYEKKIERAALLATRARSNRDWHIRTMEALVSEANAYAKLFGYRRQFKPLDAAALDALKVKAQAEAAREAKRNTAKLKAMAARDAAALADILTNKLPAWQRCEINDIHPYNFGGVRLHTGTDYMRIIGEEVQTSQGARVPLAHVRRAMRLVMAIPFGTEWKANDHTIPVGHYAVGRVDVAGTVFVGCHRFSRAEVERVAALIAAAPETADIAV